MNKINRLGKNLVNLVQILLILSISSLLAGGLYEIQDQLHRFEGIFIYFGFLLLLFVVSEKIDAEKTSGLIRQPSFPLLVYYATMLGIPLANGAYRQGSDFREYSLFVLLIPLALLLPLVALRLHRQ